LVVLVNCSRYHPDKNGDDPVASDLFQEVTFSYNILSDPDKRRQYDTSGFEVIHTCISVFQSFLFLIWVCYGNLLHYAQAIESNSQEMELDLSSLNTVNTVFAALVR
jgi:curved DNA-binding protein CbpA